MFYNIIHIICYILFKILFRLEAVGLEHIPSDGPLLLCANHASNLDPFLIGTVIFKRQLWFMAKSEAYVNSRFIRILYKQLNMFPVKRQGIDKKALDNALRIIAEGKALLLFPEGSRTWDGHLGEFKRGSGMLAVKSEAVIIPVYVDGSYAALPRGKLLPRFSKIKIYFGAPIAPNRLATLDHHDLKKLSSSVTEKIRDQIITLGAMA